MRIVTRIGLALAGPVGAASAAASLRGRMRSELGGYPVEPPSLKSDELEAAVEGSALRVAREPGLGRTPNSSALLRGHHLERVAIPGRRLALHLAEDETPAASEDQVDLVAAGPDVGLQHAVSAQAVVKRSTPLEAVPDPASIRSEPVQAATTGAGSLGR